MRILAVRTAEPVRTSRPPTRVSAPLDTRVNCAIQIYTVLRMIYDSPEIMCFLACNARLGFCLNVKRKLHNI